MSKLGNRLSGSTKQLYERTKNVSLDISTYTRSKSSVEKEEMARLVYGSMLKRHFKRQHAGAEKNAPVPGTSQQSGEPQQLTQEPNQASEDQPQQTDDAGAGEPQQTIDPDELAIQSIEEAAERNDQVVDSKQVDWLRNAPRTYDFKSMPNRSGFFLPGSTIMASGTNHMPKTKRRRNKVKHGR